MEANGCCGASCVVNSPAPLQIQTPKRFTATIPLSQWVPPPIGTTIGGQGEGKVSLAGSKFFEYPHETISVYFSTIKIKLGSYLIKSDLWDTAGQERFRAMTPIYYRQATGIFVVYDLTQRKSFENVKNWVKEVVKIVGQLPMVLVGNKLDSKENRQVSYEEGKEYADSLGVGFFEVSAKTTENLGECFLDLYTKIFYSGEDRWKVIFIGDANVGKTALHLRLTGSSIDLSELATQVVIP